MAEPKKVLLIDDDEDFVEINRAALEAKDYVVLVAHNGEDGLEMAHSERPNAIILDVMMDTPTEGFRVAQELRASEELAKIPLIMLTSVNQEGLPWKFEPNEEWLPVDVFIDKPVPAVTLLQTVGKAIEQACGEG